MTRAYREYLMAKLDERPATKPRETRKREMSDASPIIFRGKFPRVRLRLRPEDILASNPTRWE